MRTKETKETKKTNESKNLQVPGERLPDKALAKLVKEAEKGPFMSLEKHHKKMNKWIQENSR
ncbi:MAG: hypothetical protein WC988_04530 [Patescibacteria group bacterium]